MKRFIVILTISLFSISLFSKSSQYENDLVVIKSVVSSARPNDNDLDLTQTQIVTVELTASGRNYMQAYGYNEVSVTVSPKNHIWDFLIDTRSSKHAYLSINKPRGTVTFECKKQCRNDDFKIEKLYWMH